MSRGYFLYILVGFCANFGRLFSSSRNLYVATLLSFSLMYLFYLSKKKKKKKSRKNGTWHYKLYYFQCSPLMLESQVLMWGLSAS